MLTENHRHYLRNAMRHVESEAQEAIGLLLGEDESALFVRYRDFPDAERIERVRAHLARLRAAMRRFMDANGISYTTGLPSIDASWAFQTRLMMARNAVMELRPRYMRGYGELDEDDARVCRALAAELGQLMDAMTHALYRGPLRRPQGGSGDALLDATADIIERHHLLEYRSRVETLLTRGGDDVVEVALLGRVSSGKSSLVNTLVDHALLPVGAVPVTAVTTRIRYGAQATAHTVDMDGQMQEVPPDSLHQYVDESANPGNRLRLREVEVRYPAPWLQPGVILTDTPGLGSLHAKASAHALDYLPRCDLGIVTIDASSTLTPQDVDLVHALRDAGAGWLVLLSKADSVDPEALAQQHAYVEHALGEALQVPVEVADVSVMADRRDALQRWRQDVLMPTLQQVRVQAGDRHQQRVQELAQRVCASLRQALAENRDEDAPTATVPQDGSVLAELEDTGQHLHVLMRQLADNGVPAWVAEVADHEVDSQGVSAEKLAERAAGLADAVVSDAVTRLRGIAGKVDDNAASLVRGAPPFVAPTSLPEVVRVPPGPRPIKRAWLRHRLQEAVGPVLQATFSAYAKELGDWIDATCRQLRRALADTREPAGTDSTDRTTIQADVQRLQDLLTG